MTRCTDQAVRWVACGLATLAASVAPLACTEKPTFAGLLDGPFTAEVPLAAVPAMLDVPLGVIVAIRGPHITVGADIVAERTDLTAASSYGGRGLVAPLHAALFKARQRWIDLAVGSETADRSSTLLGYDPSAQSDRALPPEHQSDPPLLAALPLDTTLRELVALIATAQQTGFRRIVLLGRSSLAARVTGEELLTAPLMQPTRPTGTRTTSAPAILVGVYSTQLTIEDERAALTGGSGMPTATVRVRATGTLDEDALEAKVTEFRRAYPDADRAYVGGTEATPLYLMLNVMARIRCSHAPDGRCERTRFTRIGLIPRDFDELQLAPVMPVVSP